MRVAEKLWVMMLSVAYVWDAHRLWLRALAPLLPRLPPDIDIIAGCAQSRRTAVGGLSSLEISLSEREFYEYPKPYISTPIR